MDKNKWREKMEMRRIAPSQNAWEKLEATMKTTQAPANSKYRKYYYAAAAVIAIMGVITMLYLSPNKYNENDRLASEKSFIDQRNVIMSVVADTPQIRIVEDTKKTPMVHTAHTIPHALSHIANEKSKAKKQQTTSIQSVNSKERVASRTLQSNDQNTVKEKMVSQHGNKMKNNIDQETDLLLDNALKQMRKGKQKDILTQAKASILLDEAEWEIRQKNQNLKEKIYTEIDKNYYRIKTVFSNK